MGDGMSAMWAVPGAKCVCIDDVWGNGFRGRQAPSRLPMLNEVLTIKEVFGAEEWAGANIPGGAAVSFVELGHDWCFAISSFQPLVTRTQEQDLAIFLPLLTDLPVKAGA